MKSAFRLLIALLITNVSFASTGKLTGYVKDQKTEEALIGVTVRVLDTDLGAVTDINGFYSINNIPANTYNVEASYVGYKSSTKYKVVVRSGGNPNLNFDLEESVSQLGEVVVQANPFEKLDETPLSIQKLNAEEIATYPGGNNDIAKVVQSLPGVAGSVGGFRNDVIIRGGAPNENVYYLDGIEIPNINHFSTQGSAGGPVGLLNVSFFEGVTLSSSAFGAQYDNVLSGVLQFDQRRGNNRELRTNLRVSSSETALTMEAPIFKKKDAEFGKTTILASVRRSYLQLLFNVIGLPILPDYWDYQYKISHKIDDFNEIVVTGVGSIDNFAVNPPDEFDAEQQATLEQVPLINQWSTTSGISWKRRFKNGTGFMTTAVSTNILNNDFRRYRDNVNETGLLFKNVSQEQETKLRYAYTKFLADWTLTGGAVVQNADYTNTTEDVINNFLFDNGINFWRYGIHGQASRKFFSDRLGLSAGFRMDGNTFTNSGNEIYKTFSPRLSASYQLDERGQWRLNGSLGRYFKIPPYTILGFTDRQGQLSNKTAEYIRSDHAVLGVEYLLTPAARITVEGFYKQYDQYPVSINDSVSLANLGGDFSVLGNEPVDSEGRGRTYGVEFLFQQKFTKNFYAILAYTFFKSEFTGFDRSNYIPSSWDNRHLITFTGGYKLPRNWEVSLRTRYIDQAPFAPLDFAATQANYPAIILDYSRQGEQRLGAFNQTDFRVDKKWNFSKWTLNIFLELQNVLVQQQPQQPSYGLSRDEVGNLILDQNGQPILTQIQVDGNSAILPNIGIVIDF